ncbi:MAG: UDP-N-acetylmuramoyl-L-alanine--D-glutamate ligase [Planctomycetaceae bacterium]
MELTGRRVTVMGLGRFGGGIGAVRFLSSRGATITLTDIASREQLADSLARIADVPLEQLVLGEHREADFTDRDLVVASPAVRPDQHLLQVARSTGARVTTEIGLFWDHCPAPIIGVTGSVGKSTTAALIAHILKAAGQTVWLGGNIGGSLLTDLPSIRPDHHVVLELSSFQLLYLDAERRSPHVAVVTNFYPNHLDWHRSLDEYRTAKQAILRWQTGDDRAVACLSDDEARLWRDVSERLAIVPDRGRSPATNIAESSGAPAAPTPQNMPAAIPASNVRLAITAVEAAGYKIDTIVPTALTTFETLPHRLEVLGEKRGRVFINDSKATTPEATLAALASLDRPIVLLAGGADKGVDLSIVTTALPGHVRAVALLGATAGQLAVQLRASPVAHRICDDFADAFAWAVDQSQPGDIILLSPACASFGWFRNYEERGEQFRQAWQELR